ALAAVAPHQGGPILHPHERLRWLAILEQAGDPLPDLELAGELPGVLREIELALGEPDRQRGREHLVPKGAAQAEREVMTIRHRFSGLHRSLARLPGVGAGRDGRVRKATGRRPLFGGRTHRSAPRPDGPRGTPTPRRPRATIVPEPP